jgi:glycosyltransferase involved in cell wall biosynthesis
MKIDIIVPCYNEEEVLPWSVGKLQEVAAKLRDTVQAETRLLFVDDGSRDNTWNLIREYAEKYENVSGIKLSHNEGHQNALWAGLEVSVDHCDASVSIDADLQDDENAIVDMALQVQQGVDIVYGVRKERKTDTLFKRFSAQAFYRLMKSVDKEIIYNHADFRMMSARAMKALVAYPERNLFLRGIVRMLGFREGYVYYDRRKREAGESKYPLRKMLHFSIDGITSFSIAPINMITYIGLCITLVSLIMIGYALVEHLEHNTMPGWTSILVSLWFIGGVIITGIGVIGLYIGKIYTEVKHRPRYFIDERLNL